MNYVRPIVHTISAQDLRISPLAQSIFMDTQTIFPCTAEFPQNSGPAISSMLFNFDVSGIAPSDPGTLTVSVIGDISSNTDEFYEIQVEGIIVTPTPSNLGGTGDPDCSITDTEIYDLSIPFSLAAFQAEAADGTIQVTATPVDSSGSSAPGDPDVECDCQGLQPNQVTVTLEFPGTSS